MTQSKTDFQQALVEQIRDLGQEYDELGLFKGMTDHQKATAIAFGRHVMYMTYNQIRKRYIKQTKQKYSKTA